MERPSAIRGLSPARMERVKSDMECQCLDRAKLPASPEDPGPDLNLMEAMLEKYRHQPGSLVTVLQKMQEIYGYLPLPDLRHMAVVLKIKPARVYGVATFYTQFRFTPAGKYLILLCQGTACHVNGSERIEYALCQELGINPGQTTADGLFSLTNVACLGCCSLAPVMMINGQAYGPLTPDRAAGIIKELRSRELAAVEGGEGQ